MKKILLGLLLFLFPFFTFAFTGDLYIENNFPTENKEEIIDREVFTQIIIIELSLMIISLFIKFFMRISQKPGYNKKNNIFI